MYIYIYIYNLVVPPKLRQRPPRGRHHRDQHGGPGRSPLGKVDSAPRQPPACPRVRKLGGGRWDPLSLLLWLSCRLVGLAANCSGSPKRYLTKSQILQILFAGDLWPLGGEKQQFITINTFNTITILIIIIGTILVVVLISYPRGALPRQVMPP